MEAVFMAVRALTVAAVLLGAATVAGAQQSVNLEFDQGRVTLVARDAPVRAVLAEWARLGGATIVNAERVAGPPITIELTGVPERQALDILLRSVAGYMLAPRPEGALGASAFNRILILPTSTAPRNPPPAPVTVARPVMPRPPIILRQPVPGPGDIDMLDGMPEEFPGFDDADVDADVDNGMPVPRPGIPRIGGPPQPFGAEPQIVTFGDDADPVQPESDGAAPTPTNPFGIPFGSSTRPGVVTPAPQPANGVQ
jgi:hypothetical protein